MKCDILFPDYGPGPKDSSGCHLEAGHTTPHEFVSTSGATYRWETDWACDCETCRSDDGNWCVLYWPHDASTQAAALAAQGKDGL